MQSVEWVVPGGTIEIQPNEAALAHGFGLFETLQVKGRQIQFWERHWERLAGSARAFGLSLEIAPEAVLDAVRSLVAALGSSDSFMVKLSLLRVGTGSRLLVYARPPLGPVQPEMPGLWVENASVLNERSPLAGHKTHNYMENRLLMEMARAKGCVDALRLNSRGEVAEAAMSNLFWCSKGRVYTPADRTGLLPGVVRAALLDRLEVEQGCYELEAVLRADAVYLTNSGVGLLPVGRLVRASEEITFRPAADTAALQLEAAFAEAISSEVTRL